MPSKITWSFLALLASATAMICSPICPVAWADAQVPMSQTLPKSLTVLSHPLTLKDTKGGAAGQPFIAEYIPGNETFDNWTMMFASRFVPGQDLDPKVSATTTARKIIARRETGDTVANAAVFEAKDGKSVVVDFLISQGNVFEHNIFRYFKTPKGLVSLQIARRVYDTSSNSSSDDKVKDFIKSIPTEREKILAEIMRKDLPVDDGGK